MSIVSLFTKLFKRIGKVFEHTSSSPIPPSSCFTSSSTGSYSVSTPTISNSILPLNIKTTLPTLPIIVADLEKMKKDVSVNVVLDLGSNEQMDDKISEKTIQSSRPAEEVNNTSSGPSSRPISHTYNTIEKTKQTFHPVNIPTSSHMDDPFHISPVKVQVVRTFNYLGVTNKLRSLPPIRPDSLHCMDELDKVMKAITTHYLRNKAQSDTSTPTARLDNTAVDRLSITPEGGLDKDHHTPVLGSINPLGREHTRTDSVASLFSMYGHMSEDELISRDRSVASTSIFFPNETSNNLPNSTTLLQPYTTLHTALSLSYTPWSALDSPTESDDSNNSIPEIIITPENSQDSIDYFSSSPTKDNSEDRRSKDLLDVPIRGYKKKTCPIIVSSSKGDMEYSTAGIVVGRQPQFLPANPSSKLTKLTPLRHAPTCELYSSNSFVMGDRFPRFR
ncbi:hypothetical protein D1P53_005583 [Cryptococcus gattii VGV]|nr:hypothetical protein D1P53_005583 [Cryptococcus gattii VGV]